MSEDFTEYAAEIIRSEAKAIDGLATRLGSSFNQAVAAILNCEGRVIVTGMGKSGLIGKKVTATFNSVGIASYYLHPAEALHGDLGIMRAEDLLLIISKSGQQAEAETILSVARRLGVPIILLGGTIDSPLYKRADIAIDCSVQVEACPNNLVPTSSTTAALVMGDALALALLKARNFTPEDFAELHPGGALGFRLLKHVSELHHSGDELPLVRPNATMSQMIVQMTSKRLGCVCVTDGDGKPAGIFTDGDLRRLVEKHGDVLSLSATDVMMAAPKTIKSAAILDAALKMMEEHSITQLTTVDDDGRLVGIIHLHDILKSRLV